MARPREFEESDVLDAMMSVFWSRGFDATSVQDLVDASGLGRGSLYGVFGDKQQIFERVLRRYAEKYDLARAEALEAPSAAEGIERLFDGWMASACPKSGPKGCLLLIAATDSELDQPWIKLLTLEQMKKSEEAFEALIRRGQLAGEFDDKHDPRSLARMLVVLLQGLAASARAGWSRERLRVVLDDALAGLRGAALRSRRTS